MQEPNETPDANDLGSSCEATSAQDLRATITDELQKKFDKELSAINERLMAENKLAVESAIAQIRKELEPPSQEDIQKLIDQDYLTFTVNIKVKGRDSLQTFTLCELPQKVEKQAYRRIKDKLTPLASELSALTIHLLDGNIVDKLRNLMETVEPVMDAMAEIAAVFLNPYGDHTEIDAAWVQDNLSNDRILRVIMAQLKCNRVRDFFSLVSQTSRSLTTT